jgi:hypothetical protein
VAGGQSYHVQHPSHNCGLRVEFDTHTNYSQVRVWKRSLLIIDQADSPTTATMLIPKADRKKIHEVNNTIRDRATFPCRELLLVALFEVNSREV